MGTVLPTDLNALYDSLALFDRPERERLRGFLPRDTDIDQLIRDLFAPLERHESQ